MKIVIYGTGGVGGYFGTRLAQAGNDVTFIARGKHLEVIQKNGLKLKSVKGDFWLNTAKATDSLKGIYDIDLVLICVKTWQLKEVAEKIKNVIHKNTMVISLLNGANNAEILTSVIPASQVLGGLCKIVSKVEDYGVINHATYEPTIIFGELDNSVSERAKALERILLKAGFTAKLSANIEQDIWIKFMFITTISPIGALTRATIGEMRESNEIRKMMVQIAHEIMAVAKAKGINLPNDILEKQFEIIDVQPYETTSSLQRDVMEGKPSEIEAQCGMVVKMGKELGIETPLNSFIYNCLLPLEKRARKLEKN